LSLPPSDPPDDRSPRTVFQPRQPQPNDPPAAASPPAVEPFQPGSLPTFALRGGASQRLVIGAVLNHIYKVVRFVGRGGMGDVYEGVNVNTDERVAIKVIQSHLAEDPQVQAMFRKEARTLTRLTHPTLVQYRVLAVEPDLQVLYIVTEFVDGVGLDQLIGRIRPSDGEIAALLRRLALGLKAAHDLGSIHRDISPDNILLPEARLDAAKIIDFGIAKDLATSQATIIGDGFAGKLSYVAPEQFGDFGREIGPWTDIYSLGLVMLAVSAGKPVDMGSTLVEAVDRRRAGPDLSGAPAALRPVFARMLTADPMKRFRSMDAVVAAVDAAYPSAAPPTASTSGAAAASAVKRKSNLPLIAGLLAVAVAGVVLGGGAMRYLHLLRRHEARAGSAASAAKTNPLAQIFPSAAPTEPDVSQAVGQTLAGAACSWVGMAPPTRGADGRLSLVLSGAAGDPAAVAGAVRSAVEAGGQRADLNPRGLLAVSPGACAPLDVFRAVQAQGIVGDSWIAPQAALFHPQAHGECRNDPTQALAVIQGQLGKGGADDVAMIVMGPNGELRGVFNGARGLDDLKARTSSGAVPGSVTRIGADRFSVSLCHRAPGPYGVLLVRGRGPFDLGLSQIGAAGAGPQPGDFATRFERAAKLNGWRTQMGWYEVAAQPVPGSFSAPPSDAFPSSPPPAAAAAPVIAPPSRPTYHRPSTPARSPVRAAQPPREPPPPPPKPKPSFKPIPLDRS
jgi:hypothetical protein